MTSPKDIDSAREVQKLALRFVVLIGIVSLFADLTYEGARGVIGPYLGSLGASAAVVGFVAGLGELAGFCLRSLSGYFADKTHRYWAFIFIGYAVNLLAVPMLALAGNWPIAAALIVLERTGRATRRPSVEAMLSHAGHVVGHGWAFGLHEALDQTGATIGPLVTALVLYLHGGYRHAFGVLLISALLALGTLVVARLFHPRPQELEQRWAAPLETRGFSRAYGLYVAAGALIAAGFADFSLISFHFRQASTVSESVIPVYYAAAMATGGLASLVFGRLFDAMGFAAVIVAFLVSAFFAPLVFLGGAGVAFLGMIVWGLGMGAQDSLLKAVLSRVIPANRRSVGFGVFDTGFGIAWFIGSAAMGLLYERSMAGLIALSVILQLAALPVLLLANRAARPHPPGS